MTSNSDHGIVLFDLLSKSETGDREPLRRYLAGAPTRAVDDGCRDVLLVRTQYGSIVDDRWHPFSSQPRQNPWPATPSRSALVLLRREATGSTGWFELTLPSQVRIESITCDGEVFGIRTSDDRLSVTGDHVFRVIADSAFGPPGYSEAEIESGFRKLAGRKPLDVVGPAAEGAPLGTALPLVFEDALLGSFRFDPTRPASFSQAREDGPRYTLLADPTGDIGTALARAREVLPVIRDVTEASARLLASDAPDFGPSGQVELRWVDFGHDRSVRFAVEEDTDRARTATFALDHDFTVRLLHLD